MLKIVCLGLIELAIGAASCDQRKAGYVSFFDWYAREYRKGADEIRARRAENDIASDRSRRFREWFSSPEGKRVIAAKTEWVLKAPSGFPDTVYDMSKDTAFTITSRSAGVTLTGEIDGRSGFAGAKLRRADGSYRFWTQGMSADILGV